VGTFSSGRRLGATHQPRTLPMVVVSVLLIGHFYRGASGVLFLRFRVCFWTSLSERGAQSLVAEFPANRSSHLIQSPGPRRAGQPTLQVKPALDRTAGHPTPMNLASHTREPDNLNRMALSATVHCLTGCSIGEILGMVVGTALEMDDASTIARVRRPRIRVWVSLTMFPLLRSGVGCALHSRWRSSQTQRPS
jgi:hypothetical protein